MPHHVSKVIVKLLICVPSLKIDALATSCFEGHCETFLFEFHASLKIDVPKLRD